jgi:FG-GAP-like repeat
VGDVNGDGIPDVVAVGSENLVSTLLGNGNGTFRPAITMNVQWQFLLGGALADLNGDGRRI